MPLLEKGNLSKKLTRGCNQPVEDFFVSIEITITSTFNSF